MARLENLTCIVTGSGRLDATSDGLGSATAIAFAREGATVVVNDLNEDAAQRTVDAIEAIGGRASMVIGDVTRDEVAHELAESTLSRWGRIDVLQCSVGAHGPGTVVDVDRATWDRVFAITVTSAMLASKHVIPAMSEGGAITLISSIASFRPRGLTPYSAAKGAINAMTTSMALDHAPAGIRVNAIAPGPVYTPHAAADGMSAERREKRRRASPLGIEGRPDDVAAASVFLASPEARWITGVVLPVDGGVMLTSAAR